MQLSLQNIALVFMAMGLTTADFHGSVSDVESNARNIQGKVDSWSASGGLLAALSIQNSFSGLNDAVSALSTAANSVKDSEIQVGDIESLATAISSLLNSLNKKSNDFKQVGAETIVANDISSMSKPTLDVINSLIRTVSSDCAKGSSLQPALIHIGSSFNIVNSAFGLEKVNFPTSVPCNARKESQDTLAPVELHSSATPMRPVSSINTPSSSTQSAPSTVYSTAYANGPPPSSIAAPGSMPAPPQVPGPGLGPESEVPQSLPSDISTTGTQSSEPPSLPSAILPSLAPESVGTPDIPIPSSSAPLVPGSPDMMPPFPYPNRNSTYTQAPVIISNGANSLRASDYMLLATLSIIPSIDTIL